LGSDQQSAFFESLPNTFCRSIKLFRSAIACGYDAVLAYDAGDFIDDYYVTPSLRNGRSFLFLVEVNRQGIKGIQLVPVLISRMQVNKTKGKDYEETMVKVKLLSGAFGTSIIEKETGVFVKLNN